MEMDQVSVAVTTMTVHVWMIVPVPFYPTLSMTVSVQLEPLDTTVWKVSIS